MSGILHVQGLLDAAAGHPGRGEHGRHGAASGRRHRTLAVVLAALGLLGLAWGLGTWATAGRVPRATSVAGVDLGGLHRGAAVAALTEGLARAETAPVPVTVAGRRGSVDPAAAGLHLDAAATVDAAVGRTGSPRSLWRAVAGGGEVDPVSTVDARALSSALQALAGGVDVAPVDGAITFPTGRPVAHAPVPGRGLDPGAARGVLVRRWLTGPAPLALPSRVLRPAVGAAAVADAMTTTAGPATAGPLTVVSGAARAQLPPAVLAPLLSTAPDGHRLALRVDGAALAAAVLAAAPDAVTAPTDARVDVTGGAPVVVPAVDGTRIDPEALAAAAVPALRGTDERARTVAAPLLPVPAALGTADAAALGITQPLAEAATALTGDPARTANVQAAAAAVDGWLLLPGSTFSLAEALGTPSAEAGYTAAGVVRDGHLASAFDTGVPQLAATLYDAALRAGLADAGHTAHATYDARYPEGREATVALPGQDLRLGDPGPHGVLVQAWVGDGALHVRLWGTADAQVAVTTGPRTAVVVARTRVDAGPGCVPVAPQDGFDVTVTRTTSRDGAVVGAEDTTTRYAPRTGVTCTAPVDPAAPPVLAVGD